MTTITSLLRRVVVLSLGCLLPAIAAPCAQAQVTMAPLINTVAGTGTPAYDGDGGPAVDADLSAPNAVVLDGAGNYYIADTGNGVVRKVAANGTITTVAGGGPGCVAPCPATSQQLPSPAGVALDGAGNLYIADPGLNTVFKVDPLGNLSIFAGTGTAGSAGDNGPAINGQLNVPRGIRFSSGSLYIADSQNDSIRKVSGGIITTVPGLSQLSDPTDIAFDTAGNLYIADAGNSDVVELSTLGVVSVVAGTTGVSGYDGDGGPATSAMLANPSGVSLDASGNLYIADSDNAVIRKVDLSGTISTVAGGVGNGLSGDGGPADDAGMSEPFGVTADTAGNLYIADTGDDAVRLVNFNQFVDVGPAGVGSCVSTQLWFEVTDGGDINFLPSGDFDPNNNSGASKCAAKGCKAKGGKGGGKGSGKGSGEQTATEVCTVVTFVPREPGPRWFPLTVTDTDDNTSVVKTFSFGLQGTGVGSALGFTPGIINTVAGNGITGYSHDGGPAIDASLGFPFGTAVDSTGNIYIADSSNNLIRKVDILGNITTIAGNGTAGFSGDGGPATAAQLSAPDGVAVDSAGNVYIADYNFSRIRKVDVNGIITTVAGSGAGGRSFSGDGGPAVNAQLALPYSVAVDGAGNFYIADTSNQRIRKVNAAGIISTVAGDGVQGYSGDGGPATAAALNNPINLAVDAAGNLYIGDANNNRIRKVNSSGIISTVAGTGAPGYSGDGGPATAAALNAPTGVAVDAAGDLYFTDLANERIRKIDVNGIITTVAGTGVGSYNGDAGPSTSAEINLPSAIAIDGSGALFFTDYFNSRIRKIDVSSSAIQFGSVPLGQSSPPQSVAVSDIGNATLNFAAAADINTPPTFEFFEIKAGPVDCDLLNLLDIGQTCFLAAFYTPQVGGAASGTVSRGDDTFNSPHVIYLDGTSVSQQTVTFTGAPSSAPYQGTFVVTAMTNGSSLPGISGTDGVCSVGMVSGTAASATATVTMTSGTGSCVLTATWAADATYPLTTASQSTIATPIAPTVSLTVPASAAYKSIFSVVTSTSASTPAVLSVSGACMLSGSSVTMNSGTNSCSVMANWAADNNYTVAVLSQMVAATPIAPTVSLSVPSNALYKTTFLVSSSTNASTTPSYSVTGVCSISGASVTMSSGTGSCLVAASWAADGNYTTAILTSPVMATRAVSATAITSNSPNPSSNGQTVTIAVKVTGVTVPTGAVTVNASSGERCTTAALNSSGVASCSIAFAGPGARTLTAIYPGDGNFGGSTSSAVSQTVNGPAASVSPSSIDFGTLYLGSIVTKTVTVTNTGNAAMTITGPLLSIVRGGNSSEFVEVNLCPKSLAAGKNCSITVTFVAGRFYTQQTATLSIMDNAPGNPQTVALTAMVINPQASLTPSSLTFSSQKIGTVSAAKIVILKNTGATTLTLGVLTISADYALTPATTCSHGQALAASASCQIVVTFKPTAKGTRTGAVTIPDNALGSPQKLSLTGTGN